VRAELALIWPWQKIGTGPGCVQARLAGPSDPVQEIKPPSNPSEERLC